MNTIDKHFVSEIDKKMAEFDKTHEKSSTQLAEIKKYQRIYRLRDVPNEWHEQRDVMWDGFKD